MGRRLFFEELKSVFPTDCTDCSTRLFGNVKKVYAPKEVLEYFEIVMGWISKEVYNKMRFLLCRITVNRRDSNQLILRTSHSLFH